jgi:hypothetical protein
MANSRMGERAKSLASRPRVSHQSRMIEGQVIGSAERWSRLLGWATCLGLLAGIIGPFGSYPANSFSRILYWIGLFVLGTLILWPLAISCARIAAQRGMPNMLGIGVALAVGCVPIATLAAAGGHLLWPVHAGAMRAVEWYGQTLCIAGPALAGALWLEFYRHGVVESAAPMATDADETPAEAQLFDHLLASAYCLQMEDHHVRLHGPGFSRLHLATLREAIDRIGEDKGLQVHRSWWVARDAIESWAADGRSVRLTLTNGLTVPVARNRVATLREQGWLEPQRAARTLVAAT